MRKHHPNMVHIHSVVINGACSGLISTSGQVKCVQWSQLLHANNGCTDPLGDPTDTHKDALKRIHDPNMEQSVIVMGVCSGLTSHIDPSYK